MTQRKINNTLHKIKACRENGHHIEALLLNYHLNIELIRMMMMNAKPDYSFVGKKFKTMVKEFQNEISLNQELKSIINKRTFRLVKTWLDKTELYFKELKFGQPGNTKQLLLETEKIFGVLNISANKLFARKKA